MKTEIEEMLKSYTTKSVTDSINALKEVMQEIILYSLSKTDFFNHAAFYGGTALRIFHGLNRFSEDMDFSLIAPNPKFSITDYLSSIEKELSAYGFEMRATSKQKKSGSSIHSAFLKGNDLLTKKLTLL